MFGGGDGVVFIAVQLIIIIMVAFENCTHTHLYSEREDSSAYNAQTQYTIE